MTYKFNKEQHAAKIKAGLETAKKKGKKLGRPKGGLFKNEGIVICTFRNYGRGSVIGESECGRKMMTYRDIANECEVSIGTVQKILNKYKKNDKEN